MKVGDLGILLAGADSARVGDHCLILEEPVLAKVGAWGVQEEVRILCRGKEIRLPVYFVKVVKSQADSQA